ncbi:MAG: hypothetical protein N3G22_00260 [Candidatus Micrarchaeota archaeon]|nr:hypothetical protein [Candidatus Micrarchaeota archaeon]
MAGAFELQKEFLLRYLILIPIAACIFFILESEDKSVRLAAVIVLVILAQVRDWMLVSTIEKIRKNNKS